MISLVLKHNPVINPIYRPIPQIRHLSSSNKPPDIRHFSNIVLVSRTPISRCINSCEFNNRGFLRHLVCRSGKLRCEADAAWTAWHEEQHQHVVVLVDKCIEGVGVEDGDGGGEVFGEGG